MESSDADVYSILCMGQQRGRRDESMAVEKMKELYPVGMTVQDFIIRNRDNPYDRSLW